MKPHQRKLNDAKFKLRKYKTFGDIMHFDPTSRFLFRAGWRNGVKPSNQPHPFSIRASKAMRPPGVFQALRAFKQRFNLLPQ